jgi:hypothetical protein
MRKGKRRNFSAVNVINYSVAPILHNIVVNVMELERERKGVGSLGIKVVR